MRNAIRLASNAPLAMIIIVLNVQMDISKIQLTFLRAPKNVLRLVLQEPTNVMMEYV